MLHSIRVTCTLLAFLGLSTAVANAQEVVVISGFQMLEFQDASTFADRGVIPTPGNPSIQGFTYARSGVFYRINGVGADGLPERLERVDSRTGSVTIVGSLGQDVINTGIALDPTTGHLYALGYLIPQQGTWLCRIDKATGALTVIGPASPLNLGAETFAIDDTGRAYVVVLENVHPGFPFSLRVYAVDLATGALTLVGEIIENPGPNFFPGTAAFRSDGIYLLGSTTSLWALDFTTLHGTVVAPLNFTRIITVAPAAGVGLGFAEGCSGACPCTAAPASGGNGCLNGVSQFFGSNLRAFGEASLSIDTLEFSALGVPLTSFVLFQGTSLGSGAVFGDGRRCVGGTVVRIGGGAVTGIPGGGFQGVGAYPTSGDLPVSVQGQLPGPGVVRHYQALYRDINTYCTSAQFNLTNSVSIAWTP